MFRIACKISTRIYISIWWLPVLRLFVSVVNNKRCTVSVPYRPVGCWSGCTIFLWFSSVIFPWFPQFKVLNFIGLIFFKMMSVELQHHNVWYVILITECTGVLLHTFMCIYRYSWNTQVCSSTCLGICRYRPVALARSWIFLGIYRYPWNSFEHSCTCLGVYIGMHAYLHTFECIYRYTYMYNVL